MRGRVYFFQQVVEGAYPRRGLIKIGWTRRLECRRKCVETATGFRIAIVATCAGNLKTERRLHRRFAIENASHLVPSTAAKSEWFLPTARLLAYIDFLNRRAELRAAA